MWSSTSSLCLYGCHKCQFWWINGLKRHLEHKVPLLKWIGCSNHKLALTFKHLISSFQCVAETNIFLLNLWKYFHYRPLALNILGNTSEMYGESPTIPYLMASTWACMWNIPPPLWKFSWCTFNIICETKGSWSTRAVHSRLILSSHCN